MKPGRRRGYEVDPETGCHNSTGYKHPRTGYVSFVYNGKRSLASRVIWQEHHGEVPEGMQVDHTCGNRSCLNIAHFELVTPSENVRRSRVTKLDQDRAAEIRASTGRLKDTAQRFGVSEALVSLIRNGHLWSDAKAMKEAAGE